MAVGKTYPLLRAQAGGWISVPYAIGTYGDAGSDGIDACVGHGSGNHSTFPIQVAWSDVKQACYDLTGIYVWDRGTKYLNRKLPKQNPFWDNHYCSRIVGVKPMVAIGKELLAPGVYPTFTHAIISVDFCQPHYSMLEDERLDFLFPPVTVTMPDASTPKVRQEWLRYVERLDDIGIEFTQIEGGQMRYAEGTGPPQPTAGTTLINAPLLQPLNKGNLVWIWKNVPILGLISPTTLRAENILQFNGTVNSVPFPGFDGTNYPAGTLRFDGYKIVQINEAPYPAALADPNAGTVPVGAGGGPGGNADILQNQFWPSLTLDVQLVWSFFDPPAGGATKGHNLAPYRQVDKTTGTVTTGSKWFLASSDGLGTGDRLFKLADHRGIFLRSA